MTELTTHTLREILVGSAKAFGSTPALGWVDEIASGGGMSYAALLYRARALAERLAGFGLAKGDKVALFAENRPEWGVAYFGIAAAGYVVVPILTDFGTEQVDNIVTHAECKAMVASQKTRAKLGPRALDLEQVPVEDLAVGPAGTLSDAEAEKAFPPLPEDSLAAIIYTSGTTGSSKGVMLSHRNIAWNAWACMDIITVGRTDSFLSVLPLAHTYECTLGLVFPMMQGARVAYLDKPPVASVLLPALAKLKPSIMLTVPLVMEKVYRNSVAPELAKIGLYKHEWLKPLFHRIAGKKLYRKFGGRLRFFGVGGAALAPDVEKFLADAKFPYAIGYGLTETAPMLAGSAPFRTKLRAIGPRLKGVELRLADANPQTGEGEIQARGPNVMKGYYKDAARTAEVFTEDGWFRTGDTGTFDAKGRLFIKGRLKTMILGASGENIYPEEIEALINQHAPVAESLVYGEKGGLVALVHLKPEILEDIAKGFKDRVADLEHAASHVLESIRKEVNARLGAFSRIGKVKLQPEPFEKTPTQKIKRFLYPGKKDDAAAGK